MAVTVVPASSQSPTSLASDPTNLIRKSAAISLLSLPDELLVSIVRQVHAAYLIDKKRVPPATYFLICRRLYPIFRTAWLHTIDLTGPHDREWSKPRRKDQLARLALSTDASLTLRNHVYQLAVDFEILARCKPDNEADNEDEAWKEYDLNSHSDKLFVHVALLLPNLRALVSLDLRGLWSPGRSFTGTVQLPPNLRHLAVDENVFNTQMYDAVTKLKLPELTFESFRRHKILLPWESLEKLVFVHEGDDMRDLLGDLGKSYHTASDRSERSKIPLPLRSLAICGDTCHDDLAALASKTRVLPLVQKLTLASFSYLNRRPGSYWLPSVVHLTLCCREDYQAMPVRSFDDLLDSLNTLIELITLEFRGCLGTAFEPYNGLPAEGYDAGTADETKDKSTDESSDESSDESESPLVPNTDYVLESYLDGSPLEGLRDFLQGETKVTTFYYRSSNTSPCEYRFIRQDRCDEFDCDVWQLW